MFTTNYDYVNSMPLPVLAQWLCDINKCDTCWFRDKKPEGWAGKCTWHWLKADYGSSTDEGDTENAGSGKD